jgi:hypothetical protein
MPNVSGYTTKRKPRRVRPHFRYPSLTQLTMQRTEAQRNYLRVVEEVNARGLTPSRQIRLDKKGAKFLDADARLRSYYP